MLFSIATTRVVVVVLFRPVPLTSSGVCWPMPSKAQCKQPVTALSWRTWVIDHLELNDFSHWLPWADWLESLTALSWWTWVIDCLKLSDLSHWLPWDDWLESLTTLNCMTWVTDHLKLVDLVASVIQLELVRHSSHSAGGGQTAVIQLMVVNHCSHSAQGADWHCS